MLFFKFIDPENTFIITLKSVLEEFRLCGLHDSTGNKSVHTIVQNIFGQDQFQEELNTLYPRALQSQEFMDLVETYLS